MHQRAEICLPRKKKVQDCFHSNTFRIFDENIPERLEPNMVYKDHKYATRSPSETELLKTHHVPQPYNAKFITTNVRFLNAPVVHMETDNTKAEQFKWWAADYSNCERPKVPYCVNSTQRIDYQPSKTTPAHQVKDERGRTPATAIIPTLNPIGQPKTLLEHMSFIHQYDSRKLHNQPHQGGKHGTFVWTEIKRPSGDQGTSSVSHVTPASLDPKTEEPCSSSTTSSSSPHISSCPAVGSRQGTGREERRTPGGRVGALRPGSGQGGEEATGPGPQNVQC
ncbi:hypothetical protein ACEWY4_017716 [Coilia grayii]|uniref:Uncharacterized protein n=1 Tax=Coilia grayii TaxID=363190 RepID=A0ABD1JHN3_9TELE